MPTLLAQPTWIMFDAVPLILGGLCILVPLGIMVWGLTLLVRSGGRQRGGRSCWSLWAACFPGFCFRLCSTMDGFARFSTRESLFRLRLAAWESSALCWDCER